MAVVKDRTWFASVTQPMIGWVISCLVMFAIARARANPPSLQLSVSESPPAKQPEPAPEPKKEWRPPDLSKSPAVVPVADEHMVDLSTVLRLAEVQNPSIGLARQAIEEAVAFQLQARALLVPSVRAGANFRMHQGILQTSSGLMREVNSDSLYYGSGAGAVASGTVAFPGIQIFAHLGDGLFEPLAARQNVAARQFRADAVANQILLEVASRFLELVRAEAELDAMRQSEKDMNQIVQITAAFANVKLGREADASRARSEALLLHAEEVQAEENVAVASAQLTRVLSLDPSLRLRTPPQSDALLELVDARQELAQLIPIALRSRPELAALSAEIGRKEIQVRQEQLRPFFPTVALNFSGGNFGGGTNRADLVPEHPEFGRFAGRTDIDVIAYWTLQNAGAGNLALQRERRAERTMTVLDHENMVNQIRREVASAQALVLTRRQSVDIARGRLRTAEAAFKEDFIRIKGNVGLPIELLISTNRLVKARQDLIREVLGYNIAQMQLYVALGQPPPTITIDSR
jgi:outer membrane protein TolC